MIRRLTQEFVDELMGAVLLHAFMRYRRLDPLKGPTTAEIPHLHSGDPELFYSPAPKPVDLWKRSFPISTVGPCSVSDFYFPSTTMTAHAENNLVWGRRWQPLHRDSGLTVVGVDGIVQIGCRWFDRLAGYLVPAGVEVVTMDTPYNFRRTPVGYRPGQLIMGGDFNHQLAVARQAVLDLWTVIHSLQQSGRRVGLVGASYGGWLVLTAALVAQELEFVVGVAPPVDMVELLREGGTVVRAVRRGIGLGPLDLEYIDQVAGVMIPSRWEQPLPGNAITLHAARYDRFVPTERITNLANCWNSRLIMHDVAHYGLAVSATISATIAEDILKTI